MEALSFLATNSQSQLIKGGGRRSASMEALTLIGDVLVPLGKCTIGKKYSYYRNYETNVGTFQKNFKYLEAQKETVQKLVAQAKAKNENILPNVEQWLKNADKIIEDGEKFFADGKNSYQMHMKWFFPKPRSHCLRSKFAEEMTDEVLICISRGNFTTVSIQGPKADIPAKDLKIRKVESSKHWDWCRVKDSRDQYADVAKLIKARWLEIEGKFEVSKLSPGVIYEVAFEIMLEASDCEWKNPVDLKLTPPNSNQLQRSENLKNKPRQSWLEVLAGEFEAGPKPVGNLEFSFCQHDILFKKKGLLVKGVTIRPKP